MIKFEVEFSVMEGGRRAPEYTLEGDINGEITLNELVNLFRNTLIVTAGEVLKEEQAMGFEKDPVVTVDGKKKPVENVKAFGTIEIAARADMKDMILETYQGLLTRSPVLHGVYKASHAVLHNRTVVAYDLAGLTAWLATSPNFEDKDFITFVNMQPYARKLERQGVTSSTQGLGQHERGRTVKSRDKRKAAKGVRVLAPNGAYFLTWRGIRAKYKRHSIIKFIFISGSQLGLAGSFKAKAGGKPGRAYLYPAIVISVQEGGIT